MINKAIILVITRIIEFSVLFFLNNWLWKNTGNSYGVVLIFGVVAVYGLYLGVTLSNDYHEFKYGAGEPME